MKKFLTLALAVVMMLSLVVVASAATLDSRDASWNGGKSTQNIQLVVDDQIVATAKVYYVEVDWDTAKLTYTKTGTLTWDPENHEYTDSRAGYWSNLVVTVKNHSNDKITATLELPATASNGVTLKAVGAKTFDLEMPVEGSAFATAPSNTFTITAEGEPTSNDFTMQASVSVAAYVAP